MIAANTHSLNSTASQAARIIDMVMSGGISRCLSLLSHTKTLSEDLSINRTRERERARQDGSVCTEAIYSCLQENQNVDREILRNKQK